MLYILFCGLESSESGIMVDGLYLGMGRIKVSPSGAPSIMPLLS